MRKILIGLTVLGVLAMPTVAHAGDQSAQDHVTSGSYAMSQTEVASLVPSTLYSQSAEGRATVSANATLHCYGAVKWKAGVNVVGITLWKEWNHTAWCGYPFVSILKGSVSGHTDVWTGPVWTVGNVSYSIRKDPLHPKKARYTASSATFGEGAGCCTIGSETIRVPMHIFAAGGFR